MVAFRLTNSFSALRTIRPRATLQTYRTFTSSPSVRAEASFPEDASAESGGSRSKEAKETGSSPTGGEVGGAKGGEGLKGPKGKGTPSPKIHNQSVPGQAEKMSKEQQEEVDRHNEEFDKRHDRAQPAGNDKVDKSFWKG